MHWIARPRDILAGLAYGGDEWRQGFSHIRRADARDERDAPIAVSGFDFIDDFHQLVRLHLFADFDADGIFDTAKVFEMCVAKVARAIANP